MNITITGVTGFVGCNLLDYLMSKGIVCESLNLRKSNWKETLNKNSQALIHLAGKAHDTSNTSQAEDYFKVNRDLTIELFKSFIESDIKEFFYFSSVKAVADTVEGELMEDVDGNPITPYGRSKFEAEQYMLAQKLPFGKRLFIIRPCMIHGPGNKGNLNLLYKIVEKGFPWPLASYENKRSFLSIDNLNYLVYSMLQNSEITSGVYNFADDEHISTNELIQIIGESIKKPISLWRIPINIINGVTLFGDKLGLPLNSERLKKLTESYVVSNSKIKKALEIERLPLTAQQGLEKTIKSFKTKY